MTTGRRYLVCFALGLGAAVAVGLARFAYALILPAMQESLAWSYSAAGALNAANAAGYLVGALLAARIVAALGATPVFVSAAFITSLTVLATAYVDTFTWFLAVRFIPGVSGAVAFIAGGVLAARVASGLGDQASFGVGLFYTGPGVGVVVSGAVVPPLLLDGASAWPLAWIGLGVASIVLACLAALAARFSAGSGDAEQRGSQARNVSLTPALASYTFYAAGYIGYMTFIIATVQERGGSAFQASLWWVTLGLSSVLSFWLWRRVLAAANGRALALVTAATGVATLLPLVADHAVVLFLSFLLFGGSFLVVVAATTNLVRLARVPAQWPAWIGYFTIAFGLGQTAGPLAGGAAADLLDTSDGVLWVSGALLVAGAVVALLQRDVAREAA